MQTAASTAGPPAQRLDQLADRSDAEHRVVCAATAFLRHTVGVRPRTRHVHRETIRHTQHQPARTASQNLAALAEQRMMPSRDQHFRRRRRSEVIVPIVLLATRGRARRSRRSARARSGRSRAAALRGPARRRRRACRGCPAPRGRARSSPDGGARTWASRPRPVRRMRRTRRAAAQPACRGGKAAICVTWRWWRGGGATLRRRRPPPGRSCRVGPPAGRWPGLGGPAPRGSAARRQATRCAGASLHGARREAAQLLAQANGERRDLRVQLQCIQFCQPRAERHLRRRCANCRCHRRRQLPLTQPAP